MNIGKKILGVVFYVIGFILFWVLVNRSLPSIIGDIVSEKSNAYIFGSCLVFVFFGLLTFFLFREGKKMLSTKSSKKQNPVLQKLKLVAAIIFIGISGLAVMNMVTNIVWLSKSYYNKLLPAYILSHTLSMILTQIFIITILLRLAIKWIRKKSEEIKSDIDQIGKE